MNAEPDHAGRWWWDERGARLTPAEDSGGLQVADSWLVHDGRVRGLDRHAERFREACARLFEVPAELTTRFLRAATERLPATGRWFPRVELVRVERQLRFRLWLRPAPPVTDTVRLWPNGVLDRRRQPDVKGVDLDYLLKLRASAVTAGADEAVLLSSAGHVLEGATTSIVWWRGRTLCGPPPGPGLLPGVTRALLTEVAVAAGHPVSAELAVPADLSGFPVWTVNALHGIRPVIAGLGRCTSTDLADAGRWRTRLRALAVPVGPGLVPAESTRKEHSDVQPIS